MKKRREEANRKRQEEKRNKRFNKSKTAQTGETTAPASVEPPTEV
jgi:hypothetical protein